MVERFKFIVNCKDEKTCETVKKDMKNNGFKNIRAVKNDLHGDHSGMKEFLSIEKAETEADKLFRKYYDNIYQITIRDA